MHDVNDDTTNKTPEDGGTNNAPEGGGGESESGAVSLIDTVRGPDDVIQPFLVDASGVRGRLVRLGPVADTILARHAYPEPVARLLGETMALSALLATMMKFDGLFTLQVQGDGPVGLLVVDLTSEGGMRAYAQFDEERVAAAVADPAAPHAEALHLLGSGQLAFTVEPNDARDRYQGVVELRGQTLAECLQHYFQQSEQVASAVRLSVQSRAEADGVARWRVGGLLLQRLPEESGAADLDGLDADEDWRRAVILMSSVGNDELCDPLLMPNELLYRLFQEDGVRVYPERSVLDRCRCSREKVDAVLGGIPPDQLADMKTEDGRVEVTCQFCNRLYSYDNAALAALTARDD